MLHPFHPNLLLLLSQLEGDCHDHLDGDRLIVQIRRFILPFLQRIECGLIQEGRSGDDLHLYDVPLFIQNCVDLHLTLNVHLPREWRIFGLYFYDYFRRSYMPPTRMGPFGLTEGGGGTGLAAVFSTPPITPPSTAPICPPGTPPGTPPHTP